MSAEAVGSALLVYAAIPQTLFVVSYAFAPWYRSSVGRALMLSGVTMMAVLDYQFVVHVFRNHQHSWGIRAVVFAAVAAALSFQAITVIRVQWLSGDTSPREDPYAEKTDDAAPV